MAAAGAARANGRTVRIGFLGGSHSHAGGKVDLPPYKRYVDDFVELAAVVRGDKPIAVTPREDLIVQEALVAASAM